MAWTMGLAERIDALDFDTVFQIVGNHVAEVREVYAPTVWHDEEEDIAIDAMPGEEWHALTGMTGQHSYSGAVMHPSEFIGEGMADEMARMTDAGEAPTLWTVVVVEVMPEEGENEAEPAGWAVLYRYA